LFLKNLAINVSVRSLLLLCILFMALPYIYAYSF
jgi:hypothetical protein